MQGCSARPLANPCMAFGTAYIHSNTKLAHGKLETKVSLEDLYNGGNRKARDWVGQHVRQAAFLENFVRRKTPRQGGDRAPHRLQRLQGGNLKHLMNGDCTSQSP